MTDKTLRSYIPDTWSTNEIRAGMCPNGPWCEARELDAREAKHAARIAELEGQVEAARGGCGEVRALQRADPARNRMGTAQRAGGHMSAKKKPIRAWAMTAVDGKFILEHTIRRTRKQVIEDDERLEGTPWKEWRKAGCRIIRVIITPEPFP